MLIVKVNGLLAYVFAPREFGARVCRRNARLGAYFDRVVEDSESIIDHRSDESFIGVV